MANLRLKRPHDSPIEGHSKITANQLSPKRRGVLMVGDPTQPIHLEYPLEVANLQMAEPHHISRGPMVQRRRASKSKTANIMRRNGYHDTRRDKKDMIAQRQAAGQHKTPELRTRWTNRGLPGQPNLAIHWQGKAKQPHRLNLFRSIGGKRGKKSNRQIAALLTRATTGSHTWYRCEKKIPHRQK